MPYAECSLIIYFSAVVGIDGLGLIQGGRVMRDIGVW